MLEIDLPLSLAQEATAQGQSLTPLKASSVARAAARLAHQEWCFAWPDGWFKGIFRDCLPGSIKGDDCGAVIDTVAIG